MAAPSAARRALRRLAAAFIYRDFRVLWLGAFTSSVGTWMQSVAQNWLVLTLTNSAFFLGLDAFLGQLPIILLTLIGGVVADRRDRRHLLLMSQCVQMSTAFALAALVYWDVVRVWQILTLSFISGCAQAFGGPAYQSLIPSLVRKDDLPNAIALNSIQFNLARVIGPLLAGVALATMGTVFCFTLNGFSFLAVIVALVSLHVTHVAPETSQRMMHELRAGLSYVRHEGPLLVLTALACVTTFLGTSLLTLLPVFAQSVFHKGVSEYSQLMAASGAGAVVGALVVAWMGRFRRMGATTLVIQATFGFFLVGFAISRVELLSKALLFVGGAAMMIVFSSITSLVQLIVPNEMRGRVMSTYMLAFRGGMPLGALVSGYVAARTSAPIALIINGVLLSAVACYFLARNRTLRDL
ncbi:MAG: MFS transporter [Acidobacteria bacterium]|nr:MFS transporter [Acidobacteriota bacterium]